MIELTLPFPPSVNAMWRNVGHKTLLSADGRKYRVNCMASIYEQRIPCEQIGGSLQVTIKAFPPDRRARDLDNLLKGILDALQYCGVIENDSCIDRLEISRGPRADGGSVWISICEYATAAEIAA